MRSLGAVVGLIVHTLFPFGCPWSVEGWSAPLSWGQYSHGKWIVHGFVPFWSGRGSCWLGSWRPFYFLVDLRGVIRVSRGLVQAARLMAFMAFAAAPGLVLYLAPEVFLIVAVFVSAFVWEQGTTAGMQ
jgi:hypothetical protein